MMFILKMYSHNVRMICIIVFISSSIPLPPPLHISPTYILLPPPFPTISKLLPSPYPLYSNPAEFHPRTPYIVLSPQPYLPSPAESHPLYSSIPTTLPSLALQSPTHHLHQPLHPYPYKFTSLYSLHGSTPTTPPLYSSTTTPST